MKRYYVYILKCSDGTYYTGVTNDIDRRLYEHETGYNKNSYTHFRRPVELVFYETFTNPMDAIDFEKQVKKWSRNKKEAIIEGNWEKLKKFAECRNKTSHRNKDKKDS